MDALGGGVIPELSPSMRALVSAPTVYCQCLCNGWLIARAHSATDRTILEAVTKHRLTEQHRAWAAREYGQCTDMEEAA